MVAKDPPTLLPSRHARCLTCAFLVGLGGIEPPTSALSVLRSNRLSYSPAWCGARRLHQHHAGLPLGDSRSDPVTQQPAQATIALEGRRWTSPAERITGGMVNTKANSRATAKKSSGGMASSISHVAWIARARGGSSMTGTR